MRFPSLREATDWLASAVTGVGVLAVSNRRWSPALLASALGMGLFVGVAFGPASDRLNALTSQVLAVDGGAEEEALPAPSGGGGSSTSTGGGGGGGGSSLPNTSTSTPSAPAPVAPDPVTEPPPEEPIDDTSDPIPPTSDPEPVPEPSGVVVEGTVISANPVAQSYALAVPGEQLYVVHAKKLPSTGDTVEVSVVELANGTNGEDGSRTLTGSSKSAEVAGFVSYVSPQGEEPTYTVSTLGASLPIVFQASEASPDLPKLGEFVTVDVTIGDPPEVEVEEVEESEEAEPTGECARTEPVESVDPGAALVERDREADGDPSTYFDLAGYVQAICPATSQLLLSADSTRQSGTDVTIEVPDDIDLGRIDVDQAVLALAEVAEDGTLSLAGIASDDGEKGADDSKQLQGDFK